MRNVAFNLAGPQICCRPLNAEKICHQRKSWTTARIQMKTSLQAAREDVAKILSRDLARQYEAPLDLDWSIYDSNVTFDDPTTKLSGKLQYRGMILTIGIFILPFLFTNDAVFKLEECELTPEGDKIRTRFYTSGTTRWGSKVVISGEDFFWFGPRSNKIVRHQSTWDQSTEDFWRSLRGV